MAVIAHNLQSYQTNTGIDCATDHRGCANGYVPHARWRGGPESRSWLVEGGEPIEPHLAALTLRTRRWTGEVGA
jgi:hypothetical protein